MKRKIPMPKVGDLVERANMTRMFGRVTKIKKPTHVIVRWADLKKPTTTREKIRRLALVTRRR